jgi:hypothetical protein
MTRVAPDDLAALTDHYISRVNAVLGQGREDLAAELAAAYEVDRIVLTSRGTSGSRSQDGRRNARR